MRNTITFYRFSLLVCEIIEDYNCRQVVTVKANYTLHCLSQCNRSNAALKQLWLAVSKLMFKSTDKITRSYFFSEKKITSLCSK